MAMMCSADEGRPDMWKSPARSMPMPPLTNTADRTHQNDHCRDDFHGVPNLQPSERMLQRRPARHLLGHERPRSIPPPQQPFILNSPSSILASTAYGYDTASRLKRVSDGTNSASYGYVANASLISYVLLTNNGTLRMTRTNQFDNLNRLTNLVWMVGTNVVASFSRQYNSANQVVTNRLADGSYWVYTYDFLGQVATGKRYWSDGTPVAGQQFEYTHDDIGNRKQIGYGGNPSGGDIRYANYGANLLNQYTNRDYPGYFNIIGTSLTNATVSIWSPDGSYSLASRHGEYYRGEMCPHNGSSPIFPTFNVIAALKNGTNTDIVVTNTGSALIPNAAGVYLRSGQIGRLFASHLCWYFFGVWELGFCDCSGAWSLEFGAFVKPSPFSLRPRSFSSPPPPAPCWSHARPRTTPFHQYFRRWQKSVSNPVCPRRRLLRGQRHWL